MSHFASYFVIKKDNLEDLSAAVTVQLLNGWECQGGVAVSVSNAIMYYQAMTKRAS